MWPGPRPTSIPSSILIHQAVWIQQTWVENWGLRPFLSGAGSPSNTKLLGPRPTSIPSGILFHPAVWPQCTNVTDKQRDRQTDRQTGQRSRSVGRTVSQTVAKKRTVVTQMHKDATIGGIGGSGPPKIWTDHPNFLRSCRLQCTKLGIPSVFCYVQ